MPRTPLRALVAKTSLDGHLRGVAAVVHALKNAGVEVIYGGQIVPAAIAAIANQEDVDVVGLNIGGSIGPALEVVRLLRELGMDDVLVVAGGPVQRDEVPRLREAGVEGVFPPGSRTGEIVEFVLAHARSRDRHDGARQDAAPAPTNGTGAP